MSRDTPWILQTENSEGRSKCPQVAEIKSEIRFSAKNQDLDFNLQTNTSVAAVKWLISVDRVTKRVRKRVRKNYPKKCCFSLECKKNKQELSGEDGTRDTGHRRIQRAGLSGA